MPLKPATLLKLTFLHGCFSRFLNCTNSTKSHNAPQFFLLFHNLALCITTLLTITSIWSSVNNTLPKVNYVKAIDVFLLTSFFCVVFTLLEYTIVLNCATILTVFKKTWKRRPPRKVKSTNNIHRHGILSLIIPYKEV